MPPDLRRQETSSAAISNGPGVPASGGAGQLARNRRQRRSEMADFLRRRRESMQPEQVGLPSAGRRRTPGLRREEVAHLAGVGITWYTWLEQGRDVRASLAVLEALASALRLSPAERTHLMVLGRGETPPPSKRPPERIAPALRRIVLSFDPNPCYVIGRRWDYLAWNRAASALLGDLDARPRAERNHAWLNFTDPARRQIFTDWKRESRALVAKLRADSAHHLGDPDFEDLLRALRTASPDFCREWSRHEVMGGGSGRKKVNHPLAGSLEFEGSVLSPIEAPDQRLVLYGAVPGSGSIERMQELIDNNKKER